MLYGIKSYVNVQVEALPLLIIVFSLVSFCIECYEKRGTWLNLIIVLMIYTIHATQSGLPLYALEFDCLCPLRLNRDAAVSTVTD